MPFIFNSEARPRIVRAIRFLAIDGVILAAIVVGFELGVRTLAPEYAGQVYDTEFTGGHPRAINARGYRGKAVADDKAQDEFRILGIGDSVTWGTAVAAESTWPSQLARRLDADGSRPVSSINAGYPGHGLEDIAFNLQQRWSKRDPDVIVLALSNNMVSLALARDGKEPRAHPIKPSGSAPGRLQATRTKVLRFAKGLALPRFSKVNIERGMYAIGLSGHDVEPATPYGPMLALGWKQPRLETFVVDHAWAHFEHDLTSLRDVAKATGRPFYVMYVPARFMVFDSFWDNEKHVPMDRVTIDPSLRIRSVCERLGIEYIDVSDALKAARQESVDTGRGATAFYVQFDFTHLDDTGLSVIADAVTLRLRRDGIYP